METDAQALADVIKIDGRVEVEGLTSRSRRGQKLVDVHARSVLDGFAAGQLDLTPECHSRAARSALDRVGRGFVL